MARIAGVDIPREKRLEVSLTYIFGVGRATARTVAMATDISPDTRVRDLTDDEVAKLRTYIDQNVKVEGDLRREVSQDIKRKIEIGTYQGVLRDLADRKSTRLNSSHMSISYAVF